MDFEKFRYLVDQIKHPSFIKLQGTGEAMLHPEFDKCVIYAKQKGHFTEIITNGTIKITDNRLLYLDSIGFSIDTLDEKQAFTSGRKNLDQVVDNFLDLYKRAPTKCKIFSVFYGQDISSLQLFVKKYQIPHIIQNIQYKTSYQTKYKTKKYSYEKYECKYINENRMEYFFADGTLAPCPYMIEVKDVLSKEQITKMFSMQVVPKCCEQCGELINQNRLLQ